MPTDDEFSRRPTAPSMHRTSTGSLDTRKPGSERGGTPSSRGLTNLDVIDQLGKFQSSIALDNQNTRAAVKADVKALIEGMLAEVDSRIANATRAAVESMPPPAIAPAAGDMIAVMRPKLPSMTGDPKKDAEILRDALAQNQRADSMRYGSVSEAINDTNLKLAKVESLVKGQPGVFERILRDKNVLHYVYLALVAVIGLAGQTVAQRAFTKDAVKDGAREAAASAAATVQKPSVIIVHDDK